MLGAPALASHVSFAFCGLAQVQVNEVPLPRALGDFAGRSLRLVQPESDPFRVAGETLLPSDEVDQVLWLTGLNRCPLNHSALAGNSIRPDIAIRAAVHRKRLETQPSFCVASGKMKSESRKTARRTRASTGAGVKGRHERFPPAARRSRRKLYRLGESRTGLRPLVEVSPSDPPFLAKTRVVARRKDTLVFLELAEIWAFEAAERLTFVHCSHGTFDIDVSLAAIEASPGVGFIRVHRNWLVNNAQIKAFERAFGMTTIFVGTGMGQCAAGIQVPVSRTRASSLRQQLLANAIGVRR